MKQRIKYFDLMKGVAIYLVVMGHVITFCIRGLDSTTLFKIIQEVHMPLFFFISGYLAYKDGFKCPNMLKKLNQLIVPTIIVGLAWFIFFPHTKLQSPLPDTLQGMIADPSKSGYWFTLCLFLIFTLYSALTYIFRRITTFLGHIAVVVVSFTCLFLLQDEPFCSNYLSLGLVCTFFPIFMAGVYAHRYSGVFNKIVSGNNVCFIAALLLFLPAWYYVSYYWEFPQIPKSAVSLVRSLSHFPLVIIAVAIFRPWSEHEFAPESKPSIIAKYFDFIGKESLSIYLLHYFFLFPLTALREPLMAQGQSFVPMFLISAFFAFFIIASALLTSYVIGRNRLLAKIITGKI